ncbi:MAG TPA: hypothetical protein VG206_02920 [Terriglobia bacterium]|nr:hypothetical protein [Terriglobia bacterium]
MPPVIGAIAGIIALAGTEVGIAISTTLAAEIATVIVTTGVSMIIAGVVGLIQGAISGGQRPSSMIVSARDANAAWRVPYGATRLAGVVTFVCTGGNNNQYLYMILTLCKGPIQSIDTMYFDGVAIPLDGSGNGTGQWAGLVHAEFDIGNYAISTQPFPSLETEQGGYWTSACLQRGHAKAYVKLTWNQNIFAAGVPNITFDVHGRQVYDPRTTLTVWSDNPALCIRDFLTNGTYGLMADPSSEINDASVIAAANICDATVTLKGTVETIAVDPGSGAAGTGYVTGDLIGITAGNGDCVGWVAQTTSAGHVQRINVSNPGSGYTNATNLATTGGTGTGLRVDITTISGAEATYTCNGAFEVTATPGQTLNDLSLAMSGYVAYIDGQFVLFGGAWVSPTFTLTDNDFRGPLEIQLCYSRRDLFNSVHGTYLSASNNWQPSDYPAIIDPTWVTADGGTPLWKQIDLPFTTSASMAQRIAKIQLERCRRQVTLTAHCKLTAGSIQPGDIGYIDHSRFAGSELDGGTFMVTDVSFVSDKDAGDNPALGVDLLMQQVDANIYSWTAGDEIPFVAPATSQLPSPYTVQPPTGVALSGVSLSGSDGVVHPALVVTWTPPADAFVEFIGIIYQAAGDTVWTHAVNAQASTGKSVIAGVSAGVAYTAQVWAINKAGVASSVVTVGPFTYTSTASSLHPVVFNRFWLPTNAAAQWYKIGTWVGNDPFSRMTLNFYGTATPGSGSLIGGRCEVHATLNNGASPNIQATFWGHGSAPIMLQQVKLVATAGSSTGNSWDVYIVLNANTGIGCFYESVQVSGTYTNYSTTSLGSTSDPGGPSSTIVWASGGTQVIDQTGVIAASAVDMSRSYLNKNLDNIPDGVAHFAVINAGGLNGATTNQTTGGDRAYAALDTNNRLVNTFRLTTTNSANTPTTVPLAQSGTSTTINVAAFTVTFGAGSVSYNSGSVNPGSYGLWYIYASDLTYAGGAVTYIATQTVSDLTAGEGRVYLGVITTVSSGGGVGSGGGSGPCFAGDTVLSSSLGLICIEDICRRPCGVEVETRQGMRRVLQVVAHWHSGAMCLMPDGTLVTPEHCLWVAETYLWVPAGELFTERAPYAGWVYNLEVETDHEYRLGNGWYAHNQRK